MQTSIQAKLNISLAHAASCTSYCIFVSFYKITTTESTLLLLAKTNTLNANSE